jgi:hypothetical protein
MALRKLVSFILLIILGLDLAYNGILQLMILYAKQEAYAELHGAASGSAFEKIGVPGREAGLFEGGECWLNGRLYDVREREMRNDSIFVTLYHDQTEESLVQAVRDFFSSENTPFVYPHEKAIRIIAQFHSQDQNTPVVWSWTAVSSPGSEPGYHTEAHSRESTSFLTIPTPPPRA